MTPPPALIVTQTIHDLVPYLLEEQLLWTTLGMWLFAIGVYSRATPSGDYPVWFWGSYLLLSGAILVHISSGYYISSVYTEYALVLSAMIFSGIFFAVVRVYAQNREEFDRCLRRIHDHP